MEYLINYIPDEMLDNADKQSEAITYFDYDAFHYFKIVFNICCKHVFTDDFMNIQGGITVGLFATD